MSPQKDPQHCIQFMDDDHIIRLAWCLLQAPDAKQEAWLRGFFAPEEIDLEGLRSLGKGLLEEDGIRTWFSGAGEAAPPLPPSAILFRRGEVPASMMTPSLRLVQRLGAGPENIDRHAAGARGIQVSCLPRLSMGRTAEHAMLLMLALIKNLVPSDALVRAGSKSGAGSYAEVSYNWCGLAGLGGLEGKTLGIVGLGEVGKALARRANGFGMNVLYNNRHRLDPGSEDKLKVSWQPLPQLLARADFVSLHVPNTADNEKILGAPEFALMRSGAFVINTSRGRLVDEDALYAALADKRLAGAGLDVHASEPRPVDRFCNLPNVVLTPHVAGGSRLAVLEEIVAIFDNMRAVLAGKSVVHARIETSAAPGVVN